MMDGILLLKKEKGMTSFDAVRKVSKLLSVKKAGHAGTLDPMAEGLLVIALGKATKIIEFLDKSEKEYIATGQLGVLTDTLDMTGTILETCEVPSISQKTLETVCQKFIGTYLQEVPLYSAVHVKGKRLYQYALSGKEVNLPKKEVTVGSLTLLEQHDNSFSIQAVVSKGTYIRSLIRDIGGELGVLATMSSLLRVRQGTFGLEDAVTLTEIEQGKYHFFTIAEALSQFEQVTVDEKLSFQIKNGCKLPVCFAKDRALLLDPMGIALAIYERDPEKPEMMRVLKML